MIYLNIGKLARENYGIAGRIELNEIIVFIREMKFSVFAEISLA
jgi:hypothetical protein